MLELEYGITDRWDMALYNLLDTDTTSGDTGYGGAKLETRYRLLPAGSWLVDPIIYFELQLLREGHSDAKQKAEVKLILARATRAPGTSPSTWRPRPSTSGRANGSPKPNTRWA